MNTNMTNNAVKLLWNAEELASAISVKPDTVYAWVANGKIPSACIRRLGGRALRFDVEAVRKWAVGREVL